MKIEEFNNKDVGLSKQNDLSPNQHKSEHLDHRNRLNEKNGLELKQAGAEHSSKREINSDQKTEPTLHQKHGEALERSNRFVEYTKLEKTYAKDGNVNIDRTASDYFARVDAIKNDKNMSEQDKAKALVELGKNVTAINNEFREGYEAETRGMSREEYRDFKEKIYSEADEQRESVVDKNSEKTDVTDKIEKEISSPFAKENFGAEKSFDAKETSFTSETKHVSSDVVQDYLNQRNKEAEAYLNNDFGETYKQISEYMERNGYKAEDYNVYSRDPEWQSLQRALSPDCELPPIGSNEYCTTVNALRDANVSYRHIEPCDKQRTTEEIVKYLGGGDETEGSCSSLAFAYAGNKAGYEVLDFRDGESREYFSDFDTVCTIANLPEVDSKIVYGKNDIQCAKDLLGEMETGKEYYLATGYHAAVVKKTEHGYEYLELQEPQHNGWEKLDTKSLQERFGCETNQPKEYPNVLIDIESLGKSKEFVDILGYINTAESNQKKGVFGYGR